MNNNNIEFASFMVSYLKEDIHPSISTMIARGIKREIQPETKEKVVTVKISPERLPKIKAKLSNKLSEPYSPINRVDTRGR